MIKPLFLIIYLISSIGIVTSIKADPINVTESPGGIRDVVPPFSSWSPIYINDGVINGAWGRDWLSRSGYMSNTFEFTFDRIQDGVTGEAGDANDIYQLGSVSLYVPASNRALKEFTLFSQSNGGSWQQLFSTQPVSNPYNFAKTATGGIRAVVPASSSWSPEFINDSVINGAWGRNWLSRSGYMSNTFEFTFDPDLNGTSGEIADQFTLESVALYVPASNLALKEFTLFSQSNGGSWQQLFSTQPVSNPYNFAKTATGGIRAVVPASSSWSPEFINDSVINGAWGRNWLSRSGDMSNTFEFTFDPDLNGTSGEIADQFTLGSVALYVPASNLALKEFTLFSQSNGGSWQQLFSNQPVSNPYNFAKTATGGIRAVVPASSSWSPEFINDSVINGQWGRNWLSRPGDMSNTFEFTFDPDLNGTSGEIADQFTLESVVLYVPGTNRSLKDFEISVQTTTGWQAAVPLQSANIQGEQVFSIGPFNNVLRVRLQTISNYGDAYQQINEFEVRGVWAGDNPVFTTSNVAGEQSFDLTLNATNNDGRRNNITRIKLQANSNYGDAYQQINEFEVRGVWAGDNPVFTTSNVAGEQSFDLTLNATNNDGRRNNITRIKLQANSNYGDVYQQINEFEARGVWAGDNPVFTTSNVAGEQSFDLTLNATNNDGRRNNITRIKLQANSNYGDVYQQINEFQAFGTITETLSGGFNAFDTGTAAGTIIGPLQTRVANNAAISFDVIALNTDKSAVEASFTKDVKVELLANMASVALGANSCPVTSTIIAVLPVVAINNGRSTVTMPVANNVWKEVYVRISYQPPVGSLIVTCAIDKFAIRPAAFTLTAQHGDWETAGNSQTINASTANANPTHKAGRPFSLQLKAVDSAGTTMTNYDDIPIITDSYPALVSPAGGILGALNLGTLSNSNGVISSNTAHYSEVGAISLKMNDEDFAGVDAADGSSLIHRTIASPEIIIGRFIPDHFEATTVSNGSFDDACTGFSYAGQPFTYQTVPELKITAYNSASTITQNYTGSFAKITAADFSVSSPTSDAVKLQTNGIDLIRLNWHPAAPSLNDNADGSLSFSFGADTFNHLHDANSLVAPYTNTVDLSFTEITDSDGVITQALPHLLQATGGSVRFGRIAINNAHGSELTALPVIVKTEYFNGIDWTDNTADQCTALILASQLQLSNSETGGGGWLAGNTTMVIASGTTVGTLSNNNPLASGSSILSLSAPGEGNQGFVNIKSQISGSYNWLLGDYNGNGIYDNEATARASFGLFKGSDTIIFRREIY